MTTNPNPFDAYYDNPTPENAVRLARADHSAHPGGDKSFAYHLGLAADRLAVFDEVVSALRDCRSALDHAMRADDFTGDRLLDLAGAATKARTALAKVPR
jgi:hypothetical protein